jgi:hypothetical protein
MDPEVQFALDAIHRGAPADAVAAEYRKRTGKDLVPSGEPSSLEQSRTMSEAVGDGPHKMEPWRKALALTALGGLGALGGAAMAGGAASAPGIIPMLRPFAGPATGSVLKDFIVKQGARAVGAAGLGGAGAAGWQAINKIFDRR